MTLIVGLTGGIGSGKTVASDHFASLGMPIIDTDVIARQVVEKGSPTLAQLTETFGKVILNSDGSLNRDELRSLAFSNPENKKKLDSTMHPAIQKLTEEAIQNVSDNYCIVVIPLLRDDSKFFIDILQHIICVECDMNTRIKRVQQRSQLSKDEIKRIISTQPSDQDRRQFADDIIENSGTIENVHEQVGKLHERFLQMTAQH